MSSRSLSIAISIGSDPFSSYNRFRRKPGVWLHPVSVTTGAGWSYMFAHAYKPHFTTTTQEPLFGAVFGVEFHFRPEVRPYRTDHHRSGLGAYYVWSAFTKAACPLHLFQISQLLFVEAGVFTVQLNEFIVRSALGDALVGDVENAIGGADCGEAVRDDEGGASGGE